MSRSLPPSSSQTVERMIDFILGTDNFQSGELSPTFGAFAAVFESWEAQHQARFASTLRALSKKAEMLFGKDLNSIEEGGFQAFMIMVSRLPTWATFWKPFREFVVSIYYTSRAGMQEIRLPGPTIDSGGLLIAECRAKGACGVNDSYTKTL